MKRCTIGKTIKAMDAFIVAEVVRRVYAGGTVVLDDVSIESGTGLFGPLGSNGAVQSTLMLVRMHAWDQCHVA